MAALVFDRVTKQYGGVVAVDDLSFSVPEGCILGFLGPNGAGKTTSLRMALDIIRPSSGRISVLGYDSAAVDTKASALIRALVGFLPEERGLYRRMTALDSVIYFGRLKGMTKSRARMAARELLGRLGLAAVMHRRIDALSKGMAQKVQLAAALVNTPRLVLLDEPFSGLDPVNQEVLEEVVFDLARDGATVVFSTHVMQHAERLCQRLILLAAGRKIFEGTQAEAQRLIPARVTLSSIADPTGLPGVDVAVRGAERDGWTDWEIALAPGAEPEALLLACFERGVTLHRFEPRRPSLHDIFVHMIEDAQAAAAAEAVQ